MSVIGIVKTSKRTVFNLGRIPLAVKTGTFGTFPARR